MMISSIRTIATNKAAITVAAMALLGGGAALASPGGSPPDGVPPDVASLPLDTVPPEELPVVPEPMLVDETGAPDDAASVADDRVYPPAPLVDGEDGAEDDGPNWALGNTAVVDGLSQQQRVEAFCQAREDAAEANGSNGVPPFCTSDDGNPEPPNAFGQRMAEAARGGELGEDDDEGAGPPPWAGRPDGASDDTASDDVEVERAGPPAGVPAGPPAGVPGRGRG
jgi:hypothetical protein